MTKYFLVQLTGNNNLTCNEDEIILQQRYLYKIVNFLVETCHSAQSHPSIQTLSSFRLQNLCCSIFAACLMLIYLFPVFYEDKIICGAKILLSKQ